MIKTITFQTWAVFRPWVTIFSNLPPGWKATTFGPLSRDTSAQSLRLHCDKIDLSIYRRGKSEIYVSANLPQILYGHSGRLIHTQDQFKCVLDWLNWILRQFLSPKEPNDGLVPGVGSTKFGCYFKGIDLVWQFPAAFGLPDALKVASHPRIRSLPSIHRGQAVELSGSFLQIKAYDRITQMNLVQACHPSIHCLEFGLKNEALHKIYGSWQELGFFKITLEWCQRTMRAIAEQIHGTMSIDEAQSIIAFLVHLEHQSPALNCLEEYIRSTGLKRASFARLRKLVRTHMERTPDRICLSNLFGSKKWPPVLEVPLLEFEKRHREWLEQQQRDLV